MKIPNFSGFSSIFSSNLEMFFYIFCFIAFHMVVVRLFFGPKKVRQTGRFRIKRALVIMMAIAEIGIFGALLTRDNINHSMSATTAGFYQKAGVHSYAR